MSTPLRTSRRTWTAILAVSLIVVLVGFGCAKKHPAGTGSSAANGSASLVFKKDSKIVLEQTAFLFEGAPQIVDPSHDKRDIVLTAFHPGIDADLSWQITQLVLTDESKKAQQAFVDHGSTGTAPEAKYGQLMGAGTLPGVDLRSTHHLGTPLSWAIGEGAPSRSSEIWVSEDVYRELSRTQSSTVYLDIPLEGVLSAAAGSPSLLKLVTDIKAHATSVGDRTDADLMKVTEKLAAYPIKVNGKDATVPVIKAKNWYGEITVLDTPQNPLVLAFDFHPPMDGITAKPEDVKLLNGLLSYQIIEIDP